MGLQTGYTRTATRGVFWLWVGHALSEMLWLPTAMITARLLTPAEFGVTAAASVCLLLAARLTQCGFNSSLVKMKTVTDLHLSSVFLVNLTFGLIAWGSLCAASPFIGRFFRSPATADVIPIAALSFLISPLSTVPAALLDRQMRYRAMSLIGPLTGVVSSLVTVTLAWQGYSYWSLVIGQLAGGLTQALASLTLAGWTPSFAFSRRALADVFSFGMGIYALRLLEYAALNLDSVTVGRLLGVGQLGVYDKAFNTTSRVLTRINSGGSSVSFRIFALIHEDAARFRRAYRKVVLSSTLVTAPFFAFLMVSAPQVIQVLFGSQWTATVLPFQILCASTALRVLNAYACSAIEATGGVWAEVKRQAVYCVLIVGSVYLLRGWSVAGAAAAVLGCTAVMFGILHGVLCATTVIRWRDILVPLMPSAVLSVVLAVAVWLARYAFALDTSVHGAAPRLAIEGAVAAMTYGAFFTFWRSRDVRELVRDTVGAMTPMWRLRTHTSSS